MALAQRQSVRSLELATERRDRGDARGHRDCECQPRREVFTDLSLLATLDYVLG
jgi:hypothetical protein